jgi:hypothetical protein
MISLGILYNTNLRKEKVKTMADKFKFKLLTGSDPQAQYEAIAQKDALTFYLLNTGIGYLGETPLFGGGAQKTVVMTSGELVEPEQGKLYVLHGVTYGDQTLTGLYFFDGAAMKSYSDELFSTYIAGILTKDMTGEGYTGDDNTVATTKAIMDLMNLKLSDSSIVNAAFFRKVTSHTLTADDLTNSAIQLPDGAQEGDVGLLFTADNDDEEGNEQYYFISLVAYLTRVYSVAYTNSIIMAMSDSNEITEELNIVEAEKSIVVDENDVSLNKAEAIDEEAPSADKLITEAVLVDYIQNSVLTAVNEAITEALADVVTYTVDDGSEAGA